VSELNPLPRKTKIALRIGQAAVLIVLMVLLYALTT
jgi:hypothetical protein